ncbi:NAD(P)/FAD-dependent oxidoreductase [Streptomyces sp. URMC 123]|uniref:NAD(P)/FAD-dependent oxidoreductase n=1 Tax=Streptomyces sp. URMC 123 TaxID=3423403 RepID=UPI003F1D3DA6
MHPSGSAPRPRRAVVLGAGFAGTLAAAVLADHADEVTVVERDRLPTAGTPAPRPGLPQARHAHLLWAGGARTVEALLPGTVERWLSAGARRVSLPTGLVTLCPQGWLRRWPEMQFTIACSRDLLDAVLRDEALARPQITVLDGTMAEGLLGDARRVTGVRVRDRTTGAPRELAADLVVDATGHASRAARWLTALGLPAAREETVDPGLAHATRVFRAPAGTENFPVVHVHPDAGRPEPGRGATLVPIEHHQWLVTLHGTRGGHPPRDAEGFAAFARRLPHPVVADLMEQARPLTDVQITPGTADRRTAFERLARWPRGFVVLGDAVADCNPVYGHGLTVAARGAAALREALRRGGLDDPALGRRVQRAVGRAVRTPWNLASGQDIRYPGAVGDRPPLTARAARRYLDRLVLAATGRPTVARALFDVMTLSAPPGGLLRPAVLTGVVRGPGRPPLSRPPLTTAEWGFQPRPHRRSL